MFEWLSTGTHDRRPPSADGLPFIGSLLAAGKDPLGFALETTRVCGDIAYYRIGTYTGYLLNHPDYVQHVLQSNHRNYSKENYNYEKLKPVLGEGLITSTGEDWKRKRQFVQPAFHRRRIARVGTITTRATRDLLDDWRTQSEDNQTLDMAAEMTQLTLRIVGEALFSLDISDNAHTIGTAFTTLNEDISYRFRTVFVPPLWVPTARNRAFTKAREQLDRVVYDIISERRAVDNTEQDLLDMLMTLRDESAEENISDRQIRDEVITLLLAGHETTASLLTWTWYLLSRHPQAASKLRAEVDDVLTGVAPTLDDLSALEYTNRILQEALRLYPPVWVISRKAAADDEIGGYRIPAGSVVTLSPYTVHRHSDFWENPEVFDPDRFLPHRTRARHTYAHFPFGGGPRFCIGRNFALVEARLIVAMIVQQYRFDLAPGHSVEPEPLVTLRPRGGLPMRVHPLHDTHPY